MPSKLSMKGRWQKKVFRLTVMRQNWPSIVRNVEKAIPPGVEIEYITGDEIRKEDDPE